MELISVYQGSIWGPTPIWLLKKRWHPEVASFGNPAQPKIALKFWPSSVAGSSLKRSCSLARLTCVLKGFKGKEEIIILRHPRVARSLLSRLAPGQLGA